MRYSVIIFCDHPRVLSCEDIFCSYNTHWSWVLTSVAGFLKMTAFWAMTPCSLVQVDYVLRATCENCVGQSLVSLRVVLPCMEPLYCYSYQYTIILVAFMALLNCNCSSNYYNM
jgi:hypothetical protein